MKFKLVHKDKSTDIDAEFATELGVWLEKWGYESWIKVFCKEIMMGYLSPINIGGYEFRWVADKELFNKKIIESFKYFLSFPGEYSEERGDISESVYLEIIEDECTKK